MGDLCFAEIVTQCKLRLGRIERSEIGSIEAGDRGDHFDGLKRG